MRTEENGSIKMLQRQNDNFSFPADITKGFGRHVATTGLRLP